MTRILITATLGAVIALTQTHPSIAQTIIDNAINPAPKNVLSMPRNTYRAKKRAALRSRPGYSERQLREENLSDLEILEIEQITRTAIPGAIVNIGGVWAACPCEDGDKCENQVWVVASIPGLSTGVMLSKIHNAWTVGPVQEWWFDYENHEAKVADLRQRRLNADYTQIPALNEERNTLFEEQVLLIERFPYCSAE